MATTGRFTTGRGGNFAGGGIVKDSAAHGHIAASSPPPARVSPQQTNAFVHQTNNIVVSGQSSPDDNYNLNIKFQPNLLDNYDVYTYHFKLFMVDPESASSGNILDLNNQTIIVESGVSDLTIDNVEIDEIVTPSIEAGTGTSTSVKFDIVEPAGAGLIDKIYYQSVANGIDNWATMPMYLQLQFKGRDPLTSEAADSQPGSLNSLKWIWAIKISDIKANVTTVGTIYNFNSIIYNEYAQGNASYTLKNAIRIDNLKNVSSAMKDLENKLNNNELLTLIDNNSIPDTFRIVVDPDLGRREITPFNNNTDSNRNNNYHNINFKDGVYPASTTVDKIIDSVLSHVPSLQAEFIGAQAPGQEGLPNNATISQMRPFWKIITETRPTKYDVRRSTNANEFTIFIVKYDIGLLNSNTFQEPVGSDIIETQRKRLMTYLSKSILKKKYNYIFTGLNDQIINFDLTLNNAFSIPQSRQGGIYTNLAMASKGRVMQNNSEAEAAVTQKLTSVISLYNSATSSTASTENAAAEAKNAIETSTLPDDTKQKYITLLNQSKPENRTNFLNNVIKRGGLNNDGTLNSVRTQATNLAKPQTEKITGQQLRFISDINLNDPATVGAYSEQLKYAKGKLRPIAHTEQLRDKLIGIGIESSSNSGIQKVSSMFATALHGGIGNSFQSIKLTIKGDPFWLFPQPIINDAARPFYNSLKSDADAIDWIKNSQFKVTDSVNYYGTDNFIIVRFRTPRIFNVEENTNDIDAYTEVETFSGVYKVTQLKNSFQNGVFKQELECILDSDINLINFTKEIEDNAAKKDIPTSPNDLISTNNFPTTAIKKAKLPNGKDLQKGVVSEGATATTLGPKLAAYGKTAAAQGQQILDSLRSK
jgi:hypothetical protein